MIDKVSLQGSANYLFKQGEVTITPAELVFLGEEGIETDIIIQTEINKAIYEKFKAPGTTKPVIPNLMIKFDVCGVGEAFKAKVCSKCPPGEYTFERGVKECNRCPLNAKCPGGSITQVDPGYWRKDPKITLLSRCLYD